MDEPLSNLDAKLRTSMRTELLRLHARLGVTTVYVTHDQVEAMTLGHRVAVMRDGVLLQFDRPQTLYEDPVNLFVAAFVGSPAMNLVAAEVRGGEVGFGAVRIPLSDGRRPDPNAREVVLGLRPEAFEHPDFALRRLPEIEGQVEVVEELGSDMHVFVSIDARRVDFEEARAAVDGEEGVFVRDEHVLLNARVNPKARVRPGTRIK